MSIESKQEAKTYFNSRMKNLAKLTAEDILSVDKRAKNKWEVLLSWGGPSDKFEVKSGRWAVSIKYIFEDWYTHDEIELTEAQERFVWKWLVKTGLTSQLK